MTDKVQPELKGEHKIKSKLELLQELANTSGSLRDLISQEQRSDKEMRATCQRYVAASDFLKQLKD
jgi:hypothetical protein